MTFTDLEMSKLQGYLVKKFGNPEIKLRRRKNADDSVEVLMKNEFLATIYKDEDEGEMSYDLNMAILDIDVD